MLGLMFLLNNSVRAEEVLVEARAGTYPGCLFSDSGLGKPSGLGFRSVCDATIGVAFGFSDFPVLLDLDRHLLFASPYVSTANGHLLSMTSKITTVHVSSSTTIQELRNVRLLYGLGFFLGEHSFKLKISDPASSGNSYRITEQDQGVSAKAGVGFNFSSRMDLQITSHFMRSSKKVFPGDRIYQIGTLPTPVIAANWKF